LFDVFFNVLREYAENASYIERLTKNTILFLRYSLVIIKALFLNLKATIFLIVSFEIQKMAAFI
jgi:hypothetical protein